MSGHRFSVAEDVFERFPDYVVGWLSASFTPEHVDTAAVTALLRATEDRVQKIHQDKDLKQLPEINAWRSAFSSLGWSGSKYPSSVEALIKRVARGGSLPSINPPVDLANSVSLTYCVPVGCHDLDQTEHLQVRLAENGDTFYPMGDGAEEAPDPGEIIYTSAHEVRTRRWVWRQSRNALVTCESSWIFVPVDGFLDVTGSNVEAAVSFLTSAFSEHFGAQIASGWIDRSAPYAQLSRLQIDE